jgi:hypothetical protein
MKLPPHLFNLHRQLGFAALCITGTMELVPRKIGDNRGGRPIKLHISQSWEDTVTPGLSGSHPYHWHGLLYRIWTEGRPYAARLAQQVVEQVAIDEEGMERLRSSFFDIGPDRDPKWVYDTAEFLAAINHVRVWKNDAEYLAELNLRHKARMERVAEGV